MRKVGILSAALAAAGAWGCAHPEPEPLDPGKIEAEFRARTLEDPGLLRFAERNAGAEAAPFPPARWDLDALTLAAFYYHPDLDVARARLGQARGAETTASMWPNPVATFDLEKVTNPAAGISPWVYGFSLSVPLDTLWKRGYRIEEAQHASEAAALALGEAAWRVRSRVRSALAEHLLATRELELRRSEEGARAEVVAAMERKLAVGEVFRLDVDAAQGELSTARVVIRTAEGRVAETRAALAQAIGMPQAALRGKSFTWADFDRPPSLESLSIEGALVPGLLGRLDLRGLVADYEAAEAALKREVASRYPDISLGPGLLNDQGDHKITLGPSITLPVLNQNEGPIAEADAKRHEIAARYHQQQAAAIGDFEAAQERYRSALAELLEADTTILMVERRIKATQRAVELKELDRLALTGLRLEQVQAFESRLGAVKHAQDSLGALEDALERPLGGSRPLPKSPPESPRPGSDR